MNYTIVQLMWLFFVYSVLGWEIGTIAAAIQKRKFVDVGFLYGPWCPAYGAAGITFAVFLEELKNEWFFLFLGGTIIAFLISLMTGARGGSCNQCALS